MQPDRNKPYARATKNSKVDLKLNLSGVKGTHYANLDPSDDSESESSEMDDLEKIGERGSNYSRAQVQRDIEKIVRILDKVDLGS